MIDWNQVGYFNNMVTALEGAVTKSVKERPKDNIPDDIEWVVDEICDKVDDYAAECVMHGHSKSTGKIYTGWATVVTPLNAPDWDKVIEIEEVKENKEAEDE